MFKSIVQSKPVNSMTVLRKIKDDLLRISPLLMQMAQMNEEDFEQVDISSQLTQFHKAIIGFEALITNTLFYGAEENFVVAYSPEVKKIGNSSLSLRGYIQKEAKRAKRLSGQLQNSMDALHRQVQDLQAQYPDDSHELEQELQELFQDQNIAY